MKFKPKSKLRVIVLVHQDLIPPDNVEGIEDLESQPWRTENDVITTLKNMGHHAYCVGLYSDLAAVGKAIEEFNLTEHGRQIGCESGHFETIASYHDMTAYD